MAFERENFNVARKIALDKSVLAVECNISAGCNVTKVLSMTVESYVQSSEVLNGVINYSGVVDTRVVVMAEDGQINTICSSCPFASKFENADIESGQDAYIKVKVIDYNVESIGGEMIKLVVNLEQKGFVVGNHEVGTISCHDDDVCIKNEEIDVIDYKGSAKETFTVESDINLRENIKKVILTESKTLVRSVDAGSGFVTVSGDVITRVLYLTENDKFESGYVYDTFKQEVELEGVTRESSVEGEVFVKQEDVVTEVVQDEKGGKIVVKVPVVITVRAFEQAKVTVVKDLYSVKSEVNISTESFNMTEICPVEVVEGKIEGSLSLDEEHPRVDKLLFSGGNNVTVTNSYIKDGEIFIEGIAKTTAVYLNDEDSSLHSVQLDVPFTISDKFDAEDGGILIVDAVVTDVDVVVKKGREFYYDAKVKATVSYCHDLLGGVISSAVKEEDYGDRDYAMEVIFAPTGKDLWEVAKTAKVKEEQIVAQNPEVTFPVNEDTPLVLFYQKVQ